MPLLAMLNYPAAHLLLRHPSLFAIQGVGNETAQSVLVPISIGIARFPNFGLCVEGKTLDSHAIGAKVAKVHLLANPD